jgi:hypothetical protein
LKVSETSESNQLAREKSESWETVRDEDVPVTNYCIHKFFYGAWMMIQWKK